MRCRNRRPGHSSDGPTGIPTDKCRRDVPGRTRRSSVRFRKHTRTSQGYTAPQALERQSSDAAGRYLIAPSFRAFQTRWKFFFSYRRAVRETAVVTFVAVSFCSFRCAPSVEEGTAQTWRFLRREFLISQVSSFALALFLPLFSWIRMSRKEQRQPDDKPSIQRPGMRIC